MPPFKVAVIADSHFHPPGIPVQAAWEADRRFNDRNRAVVDWVNHVDAAFVVHLGDIPHPVPGLQAHEDAMATAAEVYAGLTAPLHMVAGNHDIGDKPRPLSPVKPSNDALLERFVSRWGPLWRVVEHDGWRFVLVNTPLMNTGHAQEAVQWSWLDEVLQGVAKERVVVCLHYPPFLHQPREPEHYDNLAEPARSRLLARIEGVRAVFCGHVHHFFWHPLGPTDLYIAPSTAFVRPGYSRIGPGDAFGRDDTDKLGAFVLHIDGDDLRVEHVRTHYIAEGSLRPGQGPAPACALGVTLRHSWDEVHELPADGLEPFLRKRARDDTVLWSLFEAGVRELRLPISDARDPVTRSRIEALYDRGMRFVFFGTEAGVEEPLAEAYEQIGGNTERGWISAVSRAELHDGERFSHFPAVGFASSAPVPPNGIVRIAAEQWPADVPDVGVAGLVELPRAGESTRFEDDAHIACRVAEALMVAASGRRLFLDGYVDHDRGYFPRNGLVDRRGNPRAAQRVLVHLGRLLPGGVAWTTQHGEGVRRFQIGSHTLCVPTGAQHLLAGIDLVSGCAVEAGTSPWPRWCAAVGV
jgi:predicted phosphodiesterase